MKLIDLLRITQGVEQIIVQGRKKMFIHSEEMEAVEILKGYEHCLYSQVEYYEIHESNDATQQVLYVNVDETGGELDA